MPHTEFTAEIWETEVVVKDATDKHVFHFTILSNGTVSLNGARIEPNPAGTHDTSRYVFDAHNAARWYSVVPGEDAKPDRNIRQLARLFPDRKPKKEC